MKALEVVGRRKKRRNVEKKRGKKEDMLYNCKLRELDGVVMDDRSCNGMKGN